MLWKGLMSGLLVCTLLGMTTGSAKALQAGGVEIGDWETGSVAGIPFKELDIDVDLYAFEIGSAPAKKVWYPPTTVVDFKVRPGRPLLIRVTNGSSVERGFLLSADQNAAAPTVLKAHITLKPGESKYLGIPTSDLFYATQGNVLYYTDPLHPDAIAGRLLMLR
jgi:hypothetical protein